MNKPFTIAIVLIFAISSLMIEFVYAQPIPNPSVPEFTLELVVNSYDVSPSSTTSIDQYTGKQTVITQPGYHVVDRSIEVRIKNQAFTPYEANGTLVNLYYNVRYKGQFTETWTQVYADNYPITSADDPLSTDKQYTVLRLPDNYPDGVKVDFQVEAFLGQLVGHPLPGKPAMIFDFVFESIASSGWSNTLTLTIDWDSPTTIISTPLPSTLTPSPTVPEFPIVVILPLFVAIPLMVTVLLRKRFPKTFDKIKD